MKIALTPTASNVLRTIGHTMQNMLLPALTADIDRSNATTIVHLLRYVATRVDHEGDLLFEEIPRLQTLLGDAAAYLESGHAPGDTAARLAAAIRATLAEKRDPTIYLSVQRLAAEIAVLRQHVCDLLVILNKRVDDAAEAPGSALHQQVRRYMAWQIDQEEKIIGPSFFGQGPRR